MPILLGHLDINPDRMRTIADAEQVTGSMPARITIVGDAEDYPEAVLTYLLDALRPMVAVGAKVERQHYRRDAFPLADLLLLESSSAPAFSPRLSPVRSVRVAAIADEIFTRHAAAFRKLAE